MRGFQHYVTYATFAAKLRTCWRIKCHESSYRLCKKYLCATDVITVAAIQTEQCSTLNVVSVYLDILCKKNSALDNMLYKNITYVTYITYCWKQSIRL